MPAQFVVDTLADSGDGSLRQAVTAANDLPGDENITFAAGLTGTITLTSALPDLSSTLAANKARVSGGGIFNQATLALTRTTLTDNEASDGGEKSMRLCVPRRGRR